MQPYNNTSSFADISVGITDLIFSSGDFPRDPGPADFPEKHDKTFVQKFFAASPDRDLTFFSDIHFLRSSRREYFSGR